MLALVASAALVGPQAAQASRRDCGRQFDANGVTGAFAIIAKNVSCRSARRVVKVAKDRCLGASGPCRVRGWTCGSRVAGDETYRITCSRKRGRVAFNRYYS